MWIYKNGNTLIILLGDGTKFRICKEDNENLEFPESIDIKITNYCDLECLFCHESSDLNGTHGDLNFLFDKIKELPNGVELAIGGGNPLSHPDLVNFLVQCKSKDFVPNITINKDHIEKYFDLIKSLIENKLIYGIGISVKDFNSINFINELKYFTKNIVIHLIAGIINYEFIKLLDEQIKSKYLILGYKNFGRGENYFSKKIIENIKNLNDNMLNLVQNYQLAFDNLALEQLNVRNYVSKIEWNQYYMGEDGTFTMYIDAVKKEYASTSTSKIRYKIENKSIKTIFTHIKSINYGERNYNSRETIYW